MFFNGPVQNGDFTFASTPGKAAGIRIAAALNNLLGTSEAPHLWNTVTLAGDLRFRQHNPTTTAPVTRMDFETALIDTKYDDTAQLTPHTAGIITDADHTVVDLARTMLQHQLARGTMSISREKVWECPKCGHMTGTNHYPCRACGTTTLRAATAEHLITERHPQTPALDLATIHASHRKPPRHLLGIATNTPHRLILSRTRDHGIDLTPLGLPGLVLDPRVGLHITVLAAARQLGATTAIMTITPNALANIAAYGHHVTEHHGLRLRYTLHGHIPYPHLPDLWARHQAHRMTSREWDAFTHWFLPLASLKQTNGVPANQLSALLTYFHRAWNAELPSHHRELLKKIRQNITNGNTNWIMNKTTLTTALRTIPDHRTPGQ